jgi:hypothetical protein
MYKTIYDIKKLVTVYIGVIEVVKHKVIRPIRYEKITISIKE